MQLYFVQSERTSDTLLQVGILKQKAVPLYAHSYSTAMVKQWEKRVPSITKLLTHI